MQVENIARNFRVLQILCAVWRVYFLSAVTHAWEALAQYQTHQLLRPLDVLR